MTWKEYMVEADTWEGRENLGNTKDLIEEFEREYREEEEEVRQQEQIKEEEVFNRELPGRYTAKMMLGWGEKKYNRERERKWEENWIQWKFLRTRNLEERNCVMRQFPKLTFFQSSKTFSPKSDSTMDLHYK